MLVWGLLTALLVWASFTPHLAPPDEYHLDKAIHLFAYCALAMVPTFVLRRCTMVLAASLILAIVGIGVQIGQSAVPARQGSLADTFVIIFGIVIGLVLGLAASRRLRLSIR